VEKFTVEFYEKTDGNYSAEEFIRSLNKKMMARMYGIIGILEEREIRSESHIVNMLMMGYLK